MRHDPVRTRPLEDELDELVEDHAAAIEELHVRWLNTQLMRADGLGVLQRRSAMGGERVRLRLSNGVVLSVEPVSSQRRRLTRIHCLLSRDAGGWVVRGSDDRGHLVDVAVRGISVAWAPKRRV